mmetsp:Transcript_16942/g.22264  ORF Transcript_16942/g.22264 Transcript_16942/m.22264 type:complete len:97 (+) Transcript_16942:431-721(+)
MIGQIIPNATPDKEAPITKGISVVATAKSMCAKNAIMEADSKNAGRGMPLPKNGMFQLVAISEMTPVNTRDADCATLKKDRLALAVSGGKSNDSTI